MIRFRSILLSIAFLCAVAARPVGAQQYVFYDELTSISGVPCSYDYTGQAGSCGCWAAGICNPNGANRAIDVQWYQWWSCSEFNYVSVRGASYAIHMSGFNGEQWVVYPMALYAFGEADVYAGFLVSYLRGWDEEECLGFTSFGDSYSYPC